MFLCAAHEEKSEVFLAGRGGAREFVGEGIQHTTVCGGLCRFVCIGLFALVLFQSVRAVVAASRCCTLNFFFFSVEGKKGQVLGFPLLLLCCCAASPPSRAHLWRWQVHISQLSHVWSLSCGDFRSIAVQIDRSSGR